MMNETEPTKIGLDENGKIRTLRGQFRVGNTKEYFKALKEQFNGGNHV